MNDNDNGKPEPQAEKTPEQLASERLARYQANPESFVENSELVIGVKKTPQGLAYILGANSVSGLKNLRWDIDTHIDNAIYAAMVDAKSKVIPAKGSMFNFARGKR